MGSKKRLSEIVERRLEASLHRPFNICGFGFANVNTCLSERKTILHTSAAEISNDTLSTDTVSEERPLVGNPRRSRMVVISGDDLDHGNETGETALQIAQRLENLSTWKYRSSVLLLLDFERTGTPRFVRCIRQVIQLRQFFVNWIVLSHFAHCLLSLVRANVA